MFRHVPNALTALRLLLAVLFFAMLTYYQYDVSGRQLLSLNIAFAVYLVALFTDFLDGYLARRWKVEGVFGRIVDPFVDKVLVLGSFIFFAGKNFTIPQLNPSEIPTNVKTITGVVPWMVVLILGRELLVTSLRGSSEGSGVNFAAVFSGKLKMTLQSITILIILVYVNYRWLIIAHHVDDIASTIRDGFIWLTIGVTVISGISYVRRGIALYKGAKEAH
jgi:CDP-diacylglycerol--glycerol-3-phosphate 3-phosphatidyltransferase